MAMINRSELESAIHSSSDKIQLMLSAPMGGGGGGGATMDKTESVCACKATSAQATDMKPE